MIKPMVSILSAVFNEEKYIREMIQSVMDQKHAAWELLFVDDGSTDSTLSLIRAAATEDSRIKVIAHGEKLGKVRAFNLAFEAASGDIIVLLAGDDRLPPDSLAVRSFALKDYGSGVPAVVYCKLKTFSADSRFDGMVLPRGTATSKSGGVIAMTRCLSSLIFPIDETLIAEDLWIGMLAENYATTVVHKTTVVLDYRIHSDNSNPRGRPFVEMSMAMAARHAAWKAILTSREHQLNMHIRTRLEGFYRAETMRQNGNTLRILTVRELPLIDRMALASMSHATLYWVRTRLYRAMSGHRNA